MVTTPIYLGISGAHATGKTTIARRIGMELRAEGISVTRSSGLASRAAEIGFPKMTRHTAASTEWIITASAAAAIEAGRMAEVVLVDGTPINALAYFLAALRHRGEEGEPETLQRLTGTATLLVTPHLLHLVTVVDPAVPLAGVPGKDPDYLNPKFRSSIDEYLHAVIDDVALKHMPVDPAHPDEAVHATVEAVRKHLAGAS